MQSSDPIQSRMLDYLYGLLDDQEARDLEARIATDPEYRAAHEWAVACQQRLAVAAKTEFNQVNFSAPQKAAPMKARKAAIEHPEPDERPSVGNVGRRWALAAGLLIAISGVVVPLGRDYLGYRHQKVEVASIEAKIRANRDAAQLVTRDIQAKQAAAAAELDKAGEQWAAVQKEWTAALEQAQQAIQNKSLYVSITGPERVQPGAMNEFKIHTLNAKNHVFQEAKVEVVVRDQKGTELLRQEPRDTQGGPLTLKLSPEFWASKQLPANTELFLDVVAHDPNGGKSAVCEKVSLARPVFITHLTTDKPMYQPGETVYFRSLTLDRASFLPAPEMQLMFRLTGPNGQEIYSQFGSTKLERDIDGKRSMVNGPDGKPLFGIASAAYTIPPGSPGGEYILTVSRVEFGYNLRANNRVDSRQDVLETRKFLVNEYVADRLNKKLEFDGKSYGPGDVVQAKCEASRAEGGALSNTPVNVQVMVDGKAIEATHASRTDSQGVVNVKFTLPKTIERGDASLTVIFQDRAGPESIVRPVPLVNKKLNIDFYPEGGDLIAGIPNRVYFQVRNHKGKPADVKGYISDGMGKITEVATLTDADHPGVNQGLGVFGFTPMANVRYELIIERPTGIEGRFLLPVVKDDGVVLRVVDGVTTDEQPLRLEVRGSGKTERKLLIGAYCRGQLLEHQKVVAVPGQATEVKLTPHSAGGGVVRLTVFEEREPGDDGKVSLVPVAERLVFRHGYQKLNVRVQPEKSRYNPSEHVQLTLQATNEKGESVPAVALVSVVNKSIITMADDKTARLMPTQFLLASEVKKGEDLEHADFLVGAHPKAHETLDLLLGTQGWRRFAEVNPSDFQRKTTPQEAERLLAASGLKSKTPRETLFQEELRVNSQFEGRSKELETQMVAAQEEFQQLQGPIANSPELTQFNMELQSLSQQRVTAETEMGVRLAALQDRAAITLPLLTVGLLILAVAMMLAAAMKRVANPLPYYGAAAGAFAVCALLLVGIAMNRQVFDDRGRPTATASTPARMAPAQPEAMMMNEAMPVPGMALPEGAAADFGPAGGAGNFPAAPKAMPKEAERFDGERQRLQNVDIPVNAPNPKPGLPLDRRNAGREQLDKAMLAGGDQKKGNRGPQAPLAPGIRDVELGLIPPPAGGMPAPDFRFRMPGLVERPVRKAEFAKQQVAQRRLADGKAQQMAAAEKRMLPELPAAQPFIVREYAHIHVNTGDVRSDHTETVFWNPAIVVPESGSTKVEFDLGSDVTRYEVTVMAHTLDGRIGATTIEIEARKPFYLEPKLPIEVTATDRIDVPIRVVNDSDEQRQVQYRFLPEGLQLQSEPFVYPSLKLDGQQWMDSMTLAADQRTRRLYRFQPTLREGIAALRIDGQSDRDAPDRSERTVRVVPDGFPTNGAHSGLLEKLDRVSLPIPDGYVPGSLKVDVQLYPSTLADLQKGLDGLLREPSGCFEQTSTSNYPNLLILDYLNQSEQANPEASRRAKELLDRGYQKLTSFECMVPDGSGRRGYEWFGGQAPPHEALTAYGLLQFRDMARVYPVDPAMIKRTQDYLLACRDGNGGFSRNSRALDSFGGAPQHLTNAYLVWSMTESDPDNKLGIDVSKELQSLIVDAEKKDDPYYHALIANACLNRNKSEEALKLLNKIKAKQSKDGSVLGAETSITRSGGRDLQIETTAMSVLGWLKANRPDEFELPMQSAIKWIGQQRGGYGGFGSTQSTILALKALIAYTQAKKQPGEDGEFRVYVNEQNVGKVAFTKNTTEPLSLAIKDFEKFMTPGKKPEIKVELTTQRSYPFSVAWSCSTVKPDNTGKELTRVSTKLNKNEATEGETVQLSVELENLTDKTQGMAVAVVGLPAGLKVPEDMKQLKQMCELPVDGSAPELSFFEIRGRELVLYWRGMKPNQKYAVTVDLICNVPGEYRGPASRGYLYYNADHKHWIDPLTIRITPSKDEAAR